MGSDSLSGGALVTERLDDLEHFGPARERAFVDALVDIDRRDELHEIARHLIRPDGIPVVLVRVLGGLSRALSGLRSGLGFRGPFPGGSLLAGLLLGDLLGRCGL